MQFKTEIDDSKPDIGFTDILYVSVKEDIPYNMLNELYHELQSEFSNLGPSTCNPTYEHMGDIIALHHKYWITEYSMWIFESHIRRLKEILEKYDNYVAFASYYVYRETKESLKGDKFSFNAYGSRYGMN